MKKKMFKKTSRFKRWTIEEKIVLTIVSIIFVIYAFSLMYPFFFTFVNSLKPGSINDNVYFFTKELRWENYKTALLYKNKYQNIDLANLFFNSIWQTLLATTLGMIASSCMAYVTAKYDFKFLKILYAIGIFAMVIPIIGSTPAMYKLLSDWGIRNNPYLIGVIWFNGFGFSFLVLYSFFKTVSWTYAEAAFIDGASHFKTFIKVMIPQALPAVASVMIINAIGFWNDHMTALLYIPDYPNISLGLYRIRILCTNGLIQGGMPVFYAMMLLSLIPIMVVFIAFQKTIMSNISTGGLKG